MNAQARRILVPPGLAVMVIAWEFGVRYVPPGPDENCLIENCTPLMWLTLLPFLVAPLLAGWLMAKDHPMRPRLRILLAVSTSGVYGATLFMVCIFQCTPGDFDRPLTLGTMATLAVLGTMLAYPLVGLGSGLGARKLDVRLQP